VSLSPVARWRNQLRDSERLGAAATSVGLVLSTYMSAEGRTGPDHTRTPSRNRLAAGAKVHVSTVDRALDELEASGDLRISPPKRQIGDTLRRPGGKGATNYYEAVLLTAAEDGSIAAQRAAPNSLKSRKSASKELQGPDRKALESARKRRGSSADAPLSGSASSSPLDECQGCGEVLPLVDARALYCAECAAERDLLADLRPAKETT
jgi:hypothetical protein